MSDLDRLFYWRGIAADYFNYRGEHVTVPLDNRIRLLEAMGVDVSSKDVIAKEAYRLDVEPWQHWLPPLYLTPAKNPYFEINCKPEDFKRQLHWTLIDAEGNLVQSGDVDANTLEETGDYIFKQQRFSRRKLYINAIEPQYYQLTVVADDEKTVTQLAAFPDEVYQSNWSDNNEKVWGFIIQLYTLVSDRNWGIGDFSDLTSLIRNAVDVGVDVIGLNPLHALSTDLHNYYSPYSPSDRRYTNPLYIDPVLVEDYNEKLLTEEDRAKRQTLQASQSVDYVSVRNLKYKIYQKMFDSFVEQHFHAGTDRFLSFQHYVEAQPECLFDFAYHEARYQNWEGVRYSLSDDFSYHDIVQDIFNLNGTFTKARLALLFHCYLQWLADVQFESCQNLAQTLGMKVGLIRDLAVGADGGGAEVSSNLTLFCRKASIGAPPDPLAQTGQNWGLPPMAPSELRRSGFNHFIELLRHNMNHCGALRIDHAMSLMRLWWCPPHTTADAGAYVYYSFAEMLGLLKLESVLNNCLIIGEDLGVVPDEFRQELTKAKIFTNKIFYFEKVFGDAFKAPEHYDPHALAMLNNHDVPTLVSWWNGTDLIIRDKLNILEEGVDIHQVRNARQVEKRNLFNLLREKNLCPESWSEEDITRPADQALIEAILQLSSQVASKIFVLQLEDLLLMDAPVNVPGTFQEHANWQRKLTHSIADIFANEKIQQQLKNINKNRKA
ncbi:4-alpha-glucanotransferase [Thalassocella blandensis]|nr:4-alpha-glucanotransferase [Thalassocella blandensis]